MGWDTTYPSNTPSNHPRDPRNFFQQYLYILPQGLILILGRAHRGSLYTAKLQACTSYSLKLFQKYDQDLVYKAAIPEYKTSPLINKALQQEGK